MTEQGSIPPTDQGSIPPTDQASSPPNVPGAPTLEEAQGRSNNSGINGSEHLQELEAVLAALVSYTLMGARPRADTFAFLQEWFNGVRGKYYHEPDPSPVDHHSV